MSAWTVRYWEDDGPCSRVVEADSRRSALSLAGVPLSRVTEVTRSRMFPAFSLESITAHKPSMKIQALFLARAMALFSSGGAGRVNQLIASIPELKRIVKRQPQCLRDDLELSAKLQHLAFLPEVIAIVRSGEETGSLVTALGTSLSYLKQNLAISGKYSGQLTFGLLLLFAGMSMLFFLPFLLKEPISTLVNLRGVEVGFTLATHTLLFMNALVGGYWWLLLAVAGTGAAAVWYFRHALAEFFPFSLLYALRKVRRSIHFLVIWRAFRTAGIPLEEQCAALTAVLGSRAFRYVSERLQRGESLTETLSRRFFSPTLALAAGGLSQVDMKTFASIVDMLLVSLHEEQRAYASRVAAAAYAGGALLAVVAVLLLAFGLVFPIMNASAGAF